MKTISKLLFATFGFALSIVAASTSVKASAEPLLEGTRECHGAGTCFVTAGGTTINGQWVEVPN